MATSIHSTTGETAVREFVISDDDLSRLVELTVSAHWLASELRTTENDQAPRCLDADAKVVALMACVSEMQRIAAQGAGSSVREVSHG